MTNKEALEEFKYRLTDTSYISTEFDYFKELFNKAIECIERCEQTCVNCVYFDDEYRECEHWGGTILTDPEQSRCKEWE